MKCVGEAMAIGRSFTEALQKALRSLEKRTRRSTGCRARRLTWTSCWRGPRVPHDGRLRMVAAGAARRRDASSRCTTPPASTRGSSTRSRCSTSSPPTSPRPPALDHDLCARAKRHGFSDVQLGQLRGMPRTSFAGVRHALGIRPVFKTVDTCAAEFAATTPYHYSAYDEETEVAPRDEPKVIILGSGPNRIGQGIEFDYSCVHASFALRDAGLRDRDGQLQPRDRVHRLRHLRPALLRAADARGRARGRARRAAGRPGRRRHRAARRADPAGARAGGSRTPACRSSAPARGDPPRRGPRRVRRRAGRGRAGRAQARHRDVLRRRPADRRRRSATRCWSGRPTCSAAAAWRSSTTTSSSRPTWPRPPRSRRSARCWSTGSWRTRSRSTSTRSTTAPSSSSAA